MQSLKKMIKSNKTALSALFVLGSSILGAQTASAAYPPYSGTIFMDPDIITPSDPSLFTSTTYIGMGVRNVYDRRYGRFMDVNMHLVTAYLSDGTTIEMQINPELGGASQAIAYANEYGYSVGQLPGFLRRDVDTVTVHNGTQPFGGGNRNILIHIGQTAVYNQTGILEETLFHEAGHTSIDSYYTYDPAWNAAQSADGGYISTYGRDNPYREDLAESVLPWAAVRYKADRIGSTDYNNIVTTIPNRMAFFDGRNFDMTPFAGGCGSACPTGGGEVTSPEDGSTIAGGS